MTGRSNFNLAQLTLDCEEGKIESFGYAHLVETAELVPSARSVDTISHTWEHRAVEVYGEATVSKFCRKYPASRKPLQRFVALVREATWRHFTDVKKTFAATDYVSGRLIFDIGGNKYRVVASVDFQEQMLAVDKVLTHEEYDREMI